MSLIMCSEQVFKDRVVSMLKDYDISECKFVTGPGRSGAIAAVYVSHLTGLSFIPYKSIIMENTLIVDTAMMTGRTFRKAMKVYNTNHGICFFHETESRHVFWYEGDYK